MIMPMPSADRYDTITEQIRYNGATIARSRPIRIRKTMMTVVTMMKLKSLL